MESDYENNSNLVAERLEWQQTQISTFQGHTII